MTIAKRFAAFIIGFEIAGRIGMPPASPIMSMDGMLPQPQDASARQPAHQK
jgi:hypothetical protein